MDKVTLSNLAMDAAACLNASNESRKDGNYSDAMQQLGCWWGYLEIMDSPAETVPAVLDRLEAKYKPLCERYHGAQLDRCLGILHAVDYVRYFYNLELARHDER